MNLEQLLDFYEAKLALKRKKAEEYALLKEKVNTLRILSEKELLGITSYQTEKTNGTKSCVIKTRHEVPVLFGLGTSVKYEKKYCDNAMVCDSDTCPKIGQNKRYNRLQNEFLAAKRDLDNFYKLRGYKKK